ncbi:MAG TPA: hypothetical protein VMA34_16945 [Terracidiphilus sp.]|nr:hypothetical protein [Terracidiphilus sp.]
MRKGINAASLIVSAGRFPKVSPKFTTKNWESGEGGGSDHGESPSDT